jgi:peptidoglycan/LPS O-acetylase OafA/YrhL
MPASRPGYRADLEALRGLAILLVVAYHAGVPVFAGGFVGVDVFFVLSGYFTTRLLVKEYGTTGSVDLPAFYGRRALRLLPPLLVVVAATLAMVWTLWAPIDRAVVAGTARAVLLGRANDAFAREAVNYFAGARSPFLHTWSLGVELQVSLFGPLLILALAALGGWRIAATPDDERARRLTALLRGVGGGLAVAGGLSLGLAIWWTTTDPSWAFFGTAARAWEFAVGALLALSLPAGSTDPRAEPGVAASDERAKRGWWLQAGGLAAIVAAALLYDRWTPYPGTAALLPVIGAAAVIVGGIHGYGVLHARRSPVRALDWFGQVSYSWYLWHWPIVLTAAVLAPAMGVWARLAWSIAALLPAWLTWRWVERPLRDRRADASTGVPRFTMAAVAGCLALAFGTGALRRSAERRVERGGQRAFATARADRMAHRCWAAELPSAAPRVTPTCVFGDPNGTATVALFGDSHAEHWLAALDRLGRERGWRVELMVMGGCPVADAPELIASRSDRRGRECARWREAAVRRMIATKPAVAVLSSYDEYVARDAESSGGRAFEGRVPAEAWRRGLRRTYARLAGAGVPVAAIRGTPYPGFDVPECLSRRAAGLPMAGDCAYVRDEALHAAARAAHRSAVRDVAARGLPVVAIDMSDAVCATHRCGVVRDGRVVFTDDNHLTAAFTRAAAPVLGARLDAALAPVGARLP